MANVRWANILCNQDMEPFKMIITYGSFTSEIPVENTSIKTLKRLAMELYSVRPSNILVSQIFDGNSHDKGVC